MKSMPSPAKRAAKPALAEGSRQGAGVAAVPANLAGAWLWTQWGPQATFGVGAWLGAVALGLLIAWRPWLRVRKPFVDYAFFDFCQGLPADVRVEGRLHERWLHAMYPRAFAIPNQKTGMPILTAGWRVRNAVPDSPRPSGIRSDVENLKVRTVSAFGP